MKDKIVISLDASWADSIRAVRETADLDCVYGYKIGFYLSLTFGLTALVNKIREEAPTKKIIYDHQKAANDVPMMGIKFARLMRVSKVDHAILFPFAGPKTEEAWIKGCQDEGIDVIVGGKMTHEGFDSRSGGSISSLSSLLIYRRAAEMNVTKFVMPPNDYNFYQSVCDDMKDYTKEKPIIFSPGFGAQGCETNKYTDVPIIGRAICGIADSRGATLEWHKKLFKEK